MPDDSTGWGDGPLRGQPAPLPPISTGFATAGKTGTEGTVGADSRGQLVWALTLTSFLLWLGASSILPLLPKYLRYQEGASDAMVGAVMAAFFVGAVVFQYPSSYLADRFGRRPVLLGGLVVYAIGSLGFVAKFSPTADIGLRALQGAGAGTAEVASLAIVSTAIALERRGRAVGSIYGGQVAGMAIGPLVGSLAGVASMRLVFLGASGAALAAGIPVLLAASITQSMRLTKNAAAGTGKRFALPRFNRALAGAIIAAAAVGLILGVIESCWALLLVSRNAHDWQIGLSWTLFAASFVAMAGPGGWLADHLDRRWLAAGMLLLAVGLCAVYPFVVSVVWLLVLGGVEAMGEAAALPAGQSLLTQSSTDSEAGRVQGLFTTAQNGAIAIAALAGGALFGIAVWAPFVAGAGVAALFAISLPFVWGPVAGRVADVESGDGAVTTRPGVVAQRLQ